MSEFDYLIPESKPDAPSVESGIQSEQAGEFDYLIPNKVQAGQENVAQPEPVEESSFINDYIVEPAKNLPRSLVQAELGLISGVQSAVRGVLHPIDSAKSLHTLGSGLYEKTQPGAHPDEAGIDAAGQYAHGRYGTWANTKKTYQTDPVGMALDTMGLLTGVGLLRNAAMVPVRAGAKLIPESVPRNMYQKSAKFTTSPKRYNDRHKNIQTALDEGLMPTDKGVNKAIDKINGLNAEIDGHIGAATARGMTVDKSVLFQGVPELRNRLGGVKINAARDLDIIDNKVKAFDDHLYNNDISRLTPAQLQTFKKDAHQQINFDMSQQGASFAGNETAKTMASGARETLESLHPDIKGLNAREGAILNTLEDLQRSSSRINNRDWMGIGVPLKSVAAESIAGPWIGGATGAYSILMTPARRAQMAITLNKLQKAKPMDGFKGKRYAPKLGIQGVVQGGRLNNEPELPSGLLDNRRY